MVRKSTTLRDVAEKAGVSVATVSRLLNERQLVVPVSEATRQRVFEAAKLLGYRPNRLARGLVTDKTNVIGLSLPVYSRPDLASSRYHAMHSASMGALVDGVQAATFPRGYEVLLAQRQEYDQDPANAPRTGHCLDFLDGLLYATPNPAYSQYSEVVQRELPLVIIGNDPSTRMLSCVDIDNTRELRRMTGALLRREHKRVGLVLPITWTAPLSAYRLQGYRQALEEMGVPYDETLVKEGRFEPDWGGRMVRELLDMPNPPTAIIVGRNDMAVDALRGIKEAGRRCPEDVELIVFGDDHSFENTDPPLTALDESFFEMGQAAASLLFEVIEGSTRGTKQVFVPCNIVQRGSGRLV